MKTEKIHVYSLFVHLEQSRFHLLFFISPYLTLDEYYCQLRTDTLFYSVPSVKSPWDLASFKCAEYRLYMEPNKHIRGYVLV